MLTAIDSARTRGGRRQPAAMTGDNEPLQRIRAEYLEMPGLVLTLPQAARLWCLTASQAKSALTELVNGGFLVRDARGGYRRPSS
jgi:Fic family protein